MNRLNELNIHVPLVKKEFDRVINSIASWRLTYTTRMEAELAKLNATETKVEAENDPAINESDVVVNAWDVLAKQIIG